MPSKKSDDATRFLDGPWLEEVDSSIRLIIWNALEERSESPRTPLLEQNRPNDRLWFVASGSVAVERSKPGGRPEILAELQGPAIYGTTTFFRDSLPTMTIRATTPIQGWTLERSSYDRLRADHPEAAEALTLTIVRVLSERFDLLDRRLTSMMADHDGDRPRINEWANFRSRLFEEPAA